MSSDLISNEAIPELAAQVDLLMFRILGVVEERGFILNGPNIPAEGLAALERLVKLALIQPGLDGDKIHQWVAHPNGCKVVQYFKAEPREDYDAPPVDPGPWLT